MFYFLFTILVHCSLIIQMKVSFSSNKDMSTISDCNCNVRIDVCKKFAKDWEDMRKSINVIDTISRIMENNRVFKPFSCVEAASNISKSGIYKMHLENINITDLEVFCEEEADLGGWIVIQKRKSGSVNFYRDLHDYKKRFGDLTGDYWIGLKNLYALTSSSEQELYIQMKTCSGTKYYAKYAEFQIGNESEGYALKILGNYSGNTDDFLSLDLGMNFTTCDRVYISLLRYYKGGWWFRSCYEG